MERVEIWNLRLIPDFVMLICGVLLYIHCHFQIQRFMIEISFPFSVSYLAL